ncbi:single-stranded DNA-binding protein [Microbispora sp. CA-102843]|uniref:single-stranded DNA-binding protein n=1 Tax=Microbispora sp. CA-102843 TaxID=3239952 RepID=UPI003D8A5A33
MANETTITVVGNLVDDPEFRFTAAGHAVVRFRVASTPPLPGPPDGGVERRHQPVPHLHRLARTREHTTESLQRGTRVIVQGRLRQRIYETEPGDKRTVYELEVDEIGPSLRFATATVTKIKSAQTADVPPQQPWPAAAA